MHTSSFVCGCYSARPVSLKQTHCFRHDSCTRRLWIAKEAAVSTANVIRLLRLAADYLRDFMITKREAQQDGNAVQEEKKEGVSPNGAARKPKFSWTLVNFWLDALMLLVFLALVWVSTVIRFLFPAPSAAAGWSLWGWSMDSWTATQFALLAVLSLGILVHLMLHWSWVCGVFFGRIRRNKTGGKVPDDGIRTIYGVALMITILNVLGILIAVAAVYIQSPS